mmetsp:Transcript_46877/g.118860  ORF Transcript_46877/g.118860 Transcript_46877/m.118860 type:complete len:427 (-) Transcript_46877:8-1288(-)
MGVDPAEFKKSSAQVLNSARSTVAPTQASVAEDADEEEEYDPFNTPPDQVSRKAQDRLQTLIQFDMLLLGERSNFFESTLGTSADERGEIIKCDDAATVQEAAAPSLSKVATTAEPEQPREDETTADEPDAAAPTSAAQPADGANQDASVDGSSSSSEDSSGDSDEDDAHESHGDATAAQAGPGQLAGSPAREVAQATGAAMEVHQAGAAATEVAIALSTAPGRVAELTETAAEILPAVGAAVSITTSGSIVVNTGAPESNVSVPAAAFAAAEPPACGSSALASVSCTPSLASAAVVQQHLAGEAPGGDPPAHDGTACNVEVGALAICAGKAASSVVAAAPPLAVPTAAAVPCSAEPAGAEDVAMRDAPVAAPGAEVELPVGDVGDDPMDSSGDPDAMDEEDEDDEDDSVLQAAFLRAAQVEQQWQ